MAKTLFHVEAEWDPEAGVWVASSADVIGLVTEAPDWASLRANLQELVPELLRDNGQLPEGGQEETPIPCELTGHRTEHVEIPTHQHG